MGGNILGFSDRRASDESFRGEPCLWVVWSDGRGNGVAAEEVFYTNGELISGCFASGGFGKQLGGGCGGGGGRRRGFLRGKGVVFDVSVVGIGVGSDGGRLVGMRTLAQGGKTPNAGDPQAVSVSKRIRSLNNERNCLYTNLLV